MDEPLIVSDKLLLNFYIYWISTFKGLRQAYNMQHIFTVDDPYAAFVEYGDIVVEMHYNDELL